MYPLASALEVIGTILVLTVAYFVLAVPFAVWLGKRLKDPRENGE